MADIVVQNPPLLRVGRLTTLPQVRRELTRVYKEVRTGQLPSGEGTRLCFILMSIAKLIESSDVEMRLADLERLISGLNRTIHI